MESRRRLTLSEQLSVIDSSNLRDLLKARDDDEIHHSRPRLRGETLTLASVLAYEKRDISSTSSATTSRTLLDIIRDEEESTTNAVAGQLNTWRSFKDRLLLRRAGAAWSASSDQPNSISAADLMLPSVTSPVEARSISVHNAISSETPDPETNTTSRESIVSEYNATTSAAPQQEHVPANDSPLVREEQPIRVSLMALLEQTDRQGGGVSTVAEEAEEEEECGGGDGGGNGGAMSVCCVCMVRHKGAAFIPCGHTFCRLCSRELWVSRGNCPLCNGFILEILDIF